MPELALLPVDSFTSGKMDAETPGLRALVSAETLAGNAKGHHHTSASRKFCLASGESNFA